MRRLAAAYTLALASCATAVTTPDRPPVDPHATDSSLPADRESLIADADAGAANGPAGPDLTWSLHCAERAIRINNEDSGALWRAARAVYYQSTHADPNSDAAAVAERCMQFGALAVRHGQSAEAHFFHALCMGARAQAVQIEGLDLVKRMVKAAQTALALDKNILHGGPDRLLGGIYLRAPAWPTSVGDIDAAIEHLEKACAIAPNWPENHLLLAEAYLDDDRLDEAQAALQKAQAHLDSPAAKGWRDMFSTQVRALEQKLAKKRS